jgi:hypothetical protein
VIHHELGGNAASVVQHFAQHRQVLGVAHGGAQAHNSGDAVAYEGPQVAAAPGVQRWGRAAAPGQLVAAADGVQPLGWPPALRSVKSLSAFIVEPCRGALGTACGCFTEISLDSVLLHLMYGRFYIAHFE